MQIGNPITSRSQMTSCATLRVISFTPNVKDGVGKASAMV